MSIPSQAEIEGLAHGYKDIEIEVKYLVDTLSHLMRTSPEQKSWFIRTQSVYHSEMTRDQFIAAGWDARISTYENSDGDVSSSVIVSRK